MKPIPTYDAHETTRMKEVHGLPLASFKARAGAFVFDFLFAFVLFLAVLISGGLLINKLGHDTGDVNIPFTLKNWYGVLTIVIYSSLTTYWGNGKSPGKWVFGIRVVSLAHTKLTLWQCIERALGYAASSLEFGFGFIQYFIHPNKRTVHDRIAETIVIRDRKQRASSRKVKES